MAHDEFSETMVDPLQTIDNKYSVISVIGEGGMGIVYKAREIATNKIVAIKFLLQEHSSSDKRRFLQEMALASKLNHENIVKVISAGNTEKNIYMVMEYVDGVPLKEYSKTKNLSLNEKLAIFLKVTDGFAYAHRKKIIHRDIKPENILVTAKGEPKIMDFGLAKMVQKEEYALTKTGEIMGTPRYMSPEQIKGQVKSMDMRTDVYSLGVILYEIITGNEMIPGDSIFEILYNIQHKRPTFICKQYKDVSKELEVIWLHCTTDKWNRYKDAGALSRELKTFLNNQGNFLIKKSFYWRYHEKKILLAMALIIMITTILWSMQKRQNKKNSLNNNIEVTAVFTMKAKVEIIENLIKLNFLEEAQRKLRTLFPGEGVLEKDLLQLKIWYGQKKYQKVWKYPSIFVEDSPGIALLKIKAGYFEKENFDDNLKIKKYQKIVLYGDDDRIKAESEYYNLLNIYYNKNYDRQMIRWTAFIDEYKKQENLLLYLDEKYQGEMSLLFGESLLFSRDYFRENSLIISADKMDSIYNLFIEAKKYRGEDFRVLENLSECMLLIQKQFSLSTRKKEELYQYLQKCCELRPYDWKTQTRLARAYLKENNYFSYVNFEKALELDDGVVEPLNAMFSLNLQDGRYQDEIFWLFFRNLMMRKYQEQPDLLKSDIEKIREECSKNYSDFLANKNKTDKIDISELYTYLGKDGNVVATTQALILEGYAQNIFDYKIPEKLLQDKMISSIIEQIHQKVNENREKLLLFLLAEAYLYNSIAIYKELEGFIPEIKKKLANSQEDILVRYLAAKTLLNLCVWEPVILGTENTHKDEDLILVCYCALSEAGFIFRLDNLQNKPIKLNEQVRMILFAKIASFDNKRLEEYLHANSIYPTFLDEWLSGYINNSNNTISFISRSVLIKRTDNEALWNILSPFLQNYLHTDYSIESKYTHYFYWSSGIVKGFTTEKYIDFLKKYIHFLNQPYISGKTKLIMLNARELYESKEVEEILNKYPNVKKEFVKTLENIIIQNDYDPLRLKCCYILSVLAPYEAEFLRIMRYPDLPPIYKTLTYIMGNIHVMKPIVSSSSSHGKIKEISSLQAIVDRQHTLFKEIMSSNDSEKFKSIVHKLASFIGGGGVTYLEGQRDNVKANILMAVTDKKLFSESFNPLIKILFSQIKGYAAPTSKEITNIINKYLKSSDNHIAMSAWAAKVFLANEKDIEGFYYEAKKDQDNNNEKGKVMGIVWGIYKRMYKDVMADNSINKFISMEHRPYYQLYLEHFSININHPAKALKYITYLEYCIDLEKEVVRKAQYQYELAIIYCHINKKEEALLHINSAIKKIENYTFEIPEKRLLYRLLKAEIIGISDEDELFSILNSAVLGIQKNYILERAIKIIEQNIEKLSSKKYQDIYIETLKKQMLAIFEIHSLNHEDEKVFYQQVKNIHEKLSMYASDNIVKSFHKNSAAMIDKFLQQE